jgi:hypothetical protein
MSGLYYNPGVPVDIVPLRPSGTNSTMFTACCGVAICDDQAGCPGCGREVVGGDEPTNHLRGRARWQNATRHWDRSKLKR